METFATRLSKIRADITDKMVSDALETPRDFGYGGDNNELFHTWSLGPVIQVRVLEARLNY
jgi:hypothetical protein